VSFIIQSVLKRLLHKKECPNCGRKLTAKESNRGDLCSRCRDKEKGARDNPENNSPES